MPPLFHCLHLLYPPRYETCSGVLVSAIVFSSLGFYSFDYIWQQSCLGGLDSPWYFLVMQRNKSTLASFLLERGNDPSFTTLGWVAFRLP